MAKFNQKILQVISPEAQNYVCYEALVPVCADGSDDFVFAVETFFEELSIEVDASVVEDIASKLEQMLEEDKCFFDWKENFIFHVIDVTKLAEHL